MAERDDAVRQFEADASAFTLKVESLTKSLAEREADYQVSTHEVIHDMFLVLYTLTGIGTRVVWASTPFTLTKNP